MKRLFLVGAVSVLTMAGCTGADGSAPVAGPAGVTVAASSSAEAQPLLARYGLAGKSTVEVIDQLDRLAPQQRPAGLKASLRVGELLISDGGQEYRLPIPADRFYLSAGPYLQQTHDCFFHALTGCKGELAGRQVQVEIVDDADGAVLVDESRTTFANGFVGFWLPRDITGTLRITSDGKTAESKISTRADAPTCLTTLRLA
ncbi:CueP family metal-binding protein [Actinoplanes sichuanensis]|uniref:CueP family metal-binding protein n=1 Tax=Actinoplanes sichuanensis TaxID=512349 RepID=A0ABW4AUK7_9ACTN|nr:CueP family metal-binding protein [Actinoplanes sichuanensis]BEL04401.1 CueP family metal-binding protein [Actinoplanes sichuanensis]